MFPFGLTLTASAVFICIVVVVGAAIFLLSILFVVKIHDTNLVRFFRVTYALWRYACVIKCKMLNTTPDDDADDDEVEKEEEYR